MKYFKLIYLSTFCCLISILSFFNIIYSYYLNLYLNLNTYIWTFFISLIFASLFYFSRDKIEKKITIYEKIITVIFGYFFLPLIICIPFYFSIYNLTFINSYFEAISGFTSTGFTIFDNIKHLDQSLIIWRSSSQWIGGLFFLFFLIIIFSNKSFNFKMTNLTYAGDNNFNSENNIKDNLLRIFIIYSVLSIIILSLLNLSGIRLFNSLNMSMTLVSGGGFLPTDSLSKIISTNLQKTIFIFSLIISMLNFYLLFNLFNRNILIKEHKEDLYLIFLSSIFCLLIYFNNYDGLDIILSVISSLSNSGLTLMKSDNNLSLYFLLITIVGGSLISNSSGIKLTRFYILLKITSLEIIKLVSPNSIINKTIFNTDKKISEDNIKISFLIFISFFLSLFILSSLLVVDNIGFEKSFKLSILTLTNTVNSEIFNMQNLNFSNLLTSSKISLILFMIIGKIELISIFLIFKKILFKD